MQPNPRTSRFTSTGRPQAPHLLALIGALWLVVLAMPGTPAYGQAPLAPVEGFVEAGFQRHALSQGYGDWRGLYIQGARRRGAYEIWRFEAVFEQRFGDQGFLYKATSTRPLGERWFARGGVGVSSGSFFHPRVSIDAQLARKWGARQRLITVAGVSVFDAKDIHRDYSLALEAQYYLSGTWIAQGSVRFNLSTPGDAWSRYHFLALTHGRDRHRFLALRVGFGNEAYVLIDPLITYAGFRSHDVMFSWREWTRKGWGFNAALMHYQNPIYTRSGFQIGFFKEF